MTRPKDLLFLLAVNFLNSHTFPLKLIKLGIFCLFFQLMNDSSDKILFFLGELTCARWLRSSPLTADLTCPPGGATKMISCITRVGGDTAISAAARGLHSSIVWRTDRRTSYRCL